MRPTRARAFLGVGILLAVMSMIVGGIQAAPAEPAGTYVPPTIAYVYVRDDQGTTTANTDRLAVKASVDPSGSVCTAQMISYLKFDLGAAAIPSDQKISGATGFDCEAMDPSITIAIKASDTTDWLESGTAGDPKLPTWNSPLVLGPTVYATARRQAPASSHLPTTPGYVSERQKKRAGDACYCSTASLHR